MVLRRWSGMPLWAAAIAAPILKLLPENFSGMPAAFKVACRNEDRRALDRERPSWKMKRWWWYWCCHMSCMWC